VEDEGTEWDSDDFATFDGPARAVRCAMAAVDAMEPLGIEIRAGVHAGEFELADKEVGQTRRSAHSTTARSGTGAMRGPLSQGRALEKAM
jgi:hypothetical protein